MPAPREEATRHAVVPQAAGRSLWPAAMWTGAGAFVVCATAAIVAVAALWLPTAASNGHSMSAIRAGLLTYLASLHGGITVDSTASMFLPLGLLLIVATVLWRAGAALADVADDLGERDPVRLALAGTVQVVTFTVASLVAVPFATLGTSRAPFVGVGVAALLLAAIAAGSALARESPLGRGIAEHVRARGSGKYRDSDSLTALLPDLRVTVRAVAAAVAVYLGAGALLVAASLVVHHGRVEQLSGQVGGGWSGVPVLLLGILAAPNAVIAGASYLAGPGFALGSGTSVNVLATTHGLLPAFPLLGAVPDGDGAAPVAWALVAATPLLAGWAVYRIATRDDGAMARVRACVAAALGAGFVMLVLAWQGGGGIGSARLDAVGASPWQLGAAVFVEVGVFSLAVLGVVAAWERWAGPELSRLRSARGARVRPAPADPPADPSIDPLADSPIDLALHDPDDEPAGPNETTAPMRAIRDEPDEGSPLAG